MGSPPSSLVVRSRRTFSSPARAIWPLLCDSHMDRSSRLLFRLGVPQPIECRLPAGEGGVGSERECVSDQGVVHQRILLWDPEKHLAFRMETSEIAAARSVTAIEDEFELGATGSGVTVTRTTRAGIVGRFRILKKLALLIALKQVHRYVFQNWDRLATETRSQSPPTASGT